MPARRSLSGTFFDHTIFWRGESVNRSTQLGWAALTREPASCAPVIALTPHDGTKHPSNTADALFVRANCAVTEVSPTARALPNDIERLKLWPKLDFGLATVGVGEAAGVAALHPTAALTTSTVPP